MELSTTNYTTNIYNTTWSDYDYMDINTTNIPLDSEEYYDDNDENVYIPKPATLSKSSPHEFREFPVRIPSGHWRTFGGSGLRQSELSVHYDISTITCIVVVVTFYMFAIMMLVAARCKRDGHSSFYENEDYSRQSLIGDVPVSIETDKQAPLTLLERIRIVMKASAHTNLRTLVPTEVI